MKRFRKGESWILITTDLLSRGIDIPGMNFVVNFDVPYSKDSEGFPCAEKETYLHRIGRTGWFDGRGVAITLINEREEDLEMEMLNNIKEEYSANIEEIGKVDDLEDIYHEWVEEYYEEMMEK